MTAVPVAVATRFGVIVAQLLVVSMVLFIVLRLLPADPSAMLIPADATRADAQAIRVALGLDKPITEQYLIWFADLVRGNLGESIQARQPVLDLVLSALPITLELVFCGLVLGLVLGIGGGLASFYWRGGLFERGVEAISSLSQAIPEFLWGIILILAFGVAIPLFPFIGPIDPHLVVPRVTGFLLVDTLLSGNVDAFFDRVTHLILPSIALSMTKAPLIMRVLRSSLIEAYTEEYVAAARLRGISEARILFRHALRNASLPTVSLIGVQAGHMFGGTLLLEAIYSLPGIGGLMISALKALDLPLIQGLALAYCTAVLLLNSLVDASYLWLNPRLRKQ